MNRKKLGNLKNKSFTKGYDVFGKEYGFMLRHDPHDPFSVEHQLLKNQIKLDSISKDFLYSYCPKTYNMENHELYSFSLNFKKGNDLDSIKEVIKFTTKTAIDYDVPLEKMLFGGTEKEILKRKTDWCFDLSRLAAVILDCLGITSRFIFVANPFKAYHGHVLLEVYYQNSWGLIDPLYGYIFYEEKPINAKDILNSKQMRTLNKDYQEMFYQIALAEYDPNDPNNNYIISKCNEYTLKLNTILQDGTWQLDEDK